MISCQPSQYKLPSKSEALADYKVLEELGSGSFGSVRKAKHRPSGKKVAIKFITDVLSSTQLIRSVLREITILKSFTRMYTEERIHSHTVCLIDLKVFRDDRRRVCVAMVMDYHRRDLGSVIKESNNIHITQDHVTQVFYSILCGLKFIHSAGVLHRDVKTNNLLFSRNCRVYFCDFGLSRSAPERPPRVPQIQTKTRSEIMADLKRTKKEVQTQPRDLSPHVCTRFYRPPEVILANREYDASVDIWGAGCSILELLNGSLDNGQNGGHWKPFVGEKCFPLSPSPEEEENGLSPASKTKDQLGAILEVLGDVSSADTSFLLFKRQIKHLELFQSDLPKLELDLEFPAVDKSLLDQIASTIEFNPFFRKSAEQLLKAPVFDQVRKPEMEVEAPWRVQVEFDAPGEFDYETLESKRSIDDYLKLLVKEASTVDKLL